MNGRMASAQVLADIRNGYTTGLKSEVELLVCPPATLVAGFRCEP